MFQVGQRVKFSQMKLDECAKVAPGAVYMLSNWGGIVTSIHGAEGQIVYVKPDMDYEKWYSDNELQEA